jgi:hypothetical protein
MRALPYPLSRVDQTGAELCRDSVTPVRASVISNDDSPVIFVHLVLSSSTDARCESICLVQAGHDN